MVWIKIYPFIALIINLPGVFNCDIGGGLFIIFYVMIGNETHFRMAFIQYMTSPQGTCASARRRHVKFCLNVIKL